MVKENKTISVERIDAKKYKSIADGFYESALKIIVEKNWNSAGLLIVHAAISYADAVAIKLGGVKSRSENHHDTVKLLEKVTKESDNKSNALNQLERLIAHKSTVAYSGEVYDRQDIDKLLKHLERFKTWAEKVISD